VTKTRIIGKRLEQLFARKKLEALGALRKHFLGLAKADQKKAAALDRLSRLLNKKSEVYSVFYAMKFNKRNLGSLR
jgi:hypothetical protein